MSRDKFRLFNENNFLAIINRKVEEQTKILRKEMELIKDENLRLREEVRAISKDMQFVRSLPAYQDIKRKLF